VTDQRSKTSPANGAKSRGPVSLAGKRVSSANARFHGIHSRELLLPSEDPAEFDQLLGELAGELRPVGTLEHTLVERIAIALWFHLSATDQAGAGAAAQKNSGVAEDTYPALMAKARAEGAVIYFGDETAVREDTAWVRGFGPKGQTPVLKKPQRWDKLIHDLGHFGAGRGRLSHH